jgi:murein DD-endopeptidase MepM/ murein hydrolase activator NlpD
VFRQLSADVEDARKRQSDPGLPTGESARTLTVYGYVPKDGDDLFSVAARCGIPYETIVTANRMPSGSALAAGKSIIIPAAPGLFVPEIPESDLERIVAGARAENAVSEGVTLRPKGLPVRFRYFPGEAFTPTERAFFLNVAFRFPLPAARVTSSFGLRRNPVTGTLKRHDGVDLAAPEGSDVYAARDGVVADLGFDPVYGNYVVLEHEGSWKSVYGHLSAILTDLRKSIRSGTILGRVGSTGQSTGPHLHFELRRDGEARDPEALLPRGIGR